jgi:hypothetical protein
VNPTAAQFDHLLGTTPSRDDASQMCALQIQVTGSDLLRMRTRSCSASTSAPRLFPPGFFVYPFQVFSNIM